MVQLHLLASTVNRFLHDLCYSFVTRKRSKKYVLNNNLDSDNNGENMILLREISDSGTTDKGKKLDGIFARECFLHSL